MDLSGTWRAAIADDELRRVAFQPAFDDGDFEPIPVPGHWRSTPAFATTDGPLIYRTRFETPPDPAGGDRHWLVLDGVFYQGDVWLDGTYLGDTEGYFFPHRFEVTDALAERTEHVLGVEVACPPPADRTAKRTITGVFQHWDCLDPDWNPGGLWRPVRLERSGPVAFRALRVVCREASADRAVLAVRADIDAPAATTVTVLTRVGDHTEHAADQPLAAGLNRVAWTVTVDRPALWWPWALGDQVLHEVVVELRTPEGRTSDRRSLVTGLRQVSMRDWILRVNGERLFLKGSNQGPTRMALGEATPAELARDVQLAREAGLDLLRIHAHISRPELYGAADAAGVLIWQDLPLQWGYARGIRRQAVRQARRAVDLLGHHPSVAIWCGHNEPIRLGTEPGAPVLTPASAARFLVGQQLPTWNRTVLDRSVKRALEQADGTRPVVAHSGVLPHLPQLDGTDSHLYFGWYHGEERDLPAALRRLPRLARFVSEFGAQAVPVDAGFMEPERWPALDWERLGRTHGLQREIFDRHVPPGAYATFDDWRAATQAYQATVIKHHVETLRRLKYRPTGGFAQFCFADGHPAVTWSVLGHDRAAKAGFHALAEACRPVIVVADRPPALLTPGEPLALDVHVISDLRTPIDGAVVTARVSWAGDGHTWRFTGDVPADSCVRVGTLRLVVPAAPGPFELDLELEAADVAATNRYRSQIRAR